MFTYDPGFTSTASCESDITYHRRRQRHPALSRLLHRRARRDIPTSSKSATCCCTASCRTRSRRRTVRALHHHAHHGARAAGVVLPRLPPRCASDGDHVRRGRRAVGVLSRLHRHQRSAAARDREPPADRQDADHRRDGLQILHRPALRVSAERSRLHGELPAHDVRGAGRGVQGQPGAGASAGHHLHPARRSRAERVDLDGASGRLVGRQSRSPASRPASPACGARRMAAPTRRR